MAKEENLEDMFDLKPIIPDFYQITKPQFSDTKPTTKQHLINPETMINPSSVPQLISFENNITELMDNNYSMAKGYTEITQEIITFSSEESAKVISSQRRVSTGATPTRSPSQAQEHLVAERKRRESLTQLFITLSKLIPGLKKLDKASLLEDGINYLRALKERVKILEEQEMISKTSIDNASNPKERSINNSIERLNGQESPEIQARILDKHVLIKIFCKKQMDLMSIIPGEMDKICLNVLDMRIMTFGEAALDITILAQMQSEYEYTVKDIVDHLHTFFLNRHV